MDLEACHKKLECFSHRKTTSLCSSCGPVATPAPTVFALSLKGLQSQGFRTKSPQKQGRNHNQIASETRNKNTELERERRIKKAISVPPQA
ncbi:hypothetical protein Cni_G24513 [Canna indica]|uniref:Uncharacterized protein n=1 Tax=Canna indica TaxID=4628 RepID=A0AAQ3KV78_9LILI|nr:hypothetical protein Cni_G24513 [Canna indica]